MLSLAGTLLELPTVDGAPNYPHAICAASRPFFKGWRRLHQIMDRSIVPEFIQEAANPDVSIPRNINEAPSSPAANRISHSLTLSLASDDSH
eukprot:9459789-Pyramimonas_sp.AAC.1